MIIMIIVIIIIVRHAPLRRLSRHASGRAARHPRGRAGRIVLYYSILYYTRLDYAILY